MLAAHKLILIPIYIYIQVVIASYIPYDILLLYNS